MSHEWDLPGVTAGPNRPGLPARPEAIVPMLHTILSMHGTPKPQVIDDLRAKHGGERQSVTRLLDWLIQTSIARVEEGQTLSIHPGVHLQDLAHRLAGWAQAGGFDPSGSRSSAESADIAKWAHALHRSATSHPEALKRRSTDPDVARAWLTAGPQAVAPEMRSPSEENSPTWVAKIRTILGHIDAGFVERRHHVRAILLALIAGHHSLLLGPPGTAKSLLARSIAQSFSDATYFEYLLSRFTHPDELFGPVSIPGLKNEDYRRLTEGFLPHAHVAFLDEIFKANSAILNSLLTLINERIFHHGQHRDRSPLVGLIGASNEMPAEDGALEALYDRFLVRLSVPPIGGDDAFVAVIGGELQEISIPQTSQLTLDDLTAIRAAATHVAIEPSITDVLVSLWKEAKQHDWNVSDRRWRHATDLLRVAAASEGRTAVRPTDLMLLTNCLSPTPAKSAEVRQAILEHLRPTTAPSHALATQWSLLSVDRVGPTEEDPMPIGDPPSGWRERLSQRQASSRRFAYHLNRAVDVIAASRRHVEDQSANALWIEQVPASLLEPHIEASSELAQWLRRHEAYEAMVSSPDALCDAVTSWLPTEERIRPEHMDIVLEIGDSCGAGFTYKQWRRIEVPFTAGHAIRVEPEQFLDFLGGAIPATRLMQGVEPKNRRNVEQALSSLWQSLSPHLIPDPSR